MLCVYSVCGLSRYYILPSTRLISAAFIVLVLDPNAVLDYGFWLSFLAVAVLFIVMARHIKNSSISFLNGLKVSILMQWSIFVGLLPVLIYSGMGVSYTGLLANLVAVPLVGVVIVPLIFSGLSLMLVSDGLADLLIGLADQALALLNQLLLVFLFSCLGTLRLKPSLDTIY